MRSLLRSALLLPRELILNNKSSEDDQTATIRVWHEGKHKARSLPRPLAAATLLRPTMQPTMQEGATRCARGCNPMCQRSPYVLQTVGRDQ